MPYIYPIQTETMCRRSHRMGVDFVAPSLNEQRPRGRVVCARVDGEGVSRARVGL